MGLGRFLEQVGPMDADVQLSGGNPIQNVARPPLQLFGSGCVVGPERAGSGKASLSGSSRRGSMAGAAPLALPKETIMPRGRSELRLFRNVAAPTES